MSPKIGIVQGRLSPPMDGKVQAFPSQTWEKEFPMAQRCGFDAIEWVFEDTGAFDNPIWTDEGAERIQRFSREYHIEIPSVCADYFMKHMFFRTSPSEQAESIRTLLRLIEQGARLGIRRILLPVLEEAEIETETDREQLIACLKECLGRANDFGIELAIESNLEADRYRSLIEALAHPLAKIYYDVGNRTAMGYEMRQDIRVLSPWISGVHIKDRKRFGPSVPLGTGDADFLTCFRTLREGGFEGPYILQGARAGEETETARHYLEFVKGYFQEELHEQNSH
ncbi:MAG: sugar phosphate isomerase/epimerase [Candidatus Omnitrophica bacterium]|nr:sugar phosphate isomerase/epimerase [Candidatus Omnitrophota bacterium]